MSEPTEAEVEAAAIAVKEIDVSDGYWFWPEEAEAIARAALTAAAQVRQRANPASDGPAIRKRAPTVYSDLMPIYSATEDAGGKPRREPRQCRICGGIDYDSAEPDQCPDVPGEPKGEGS